MYGDLRSKLALYKSSMEKKAEKTSTAYSEDVNNAHGKSNDGVENPGGKKRDGGKNADSLSADGLNIYDVNPGVDNKHINENSASFGIHSSADKNGTGSGNDSDAVNEVGYGINGNAAEKGIGSYELRKSISENDIENLIDGQVCNNEEGSCFLIENKYPLSYIHGGCSLGQACSIDFKVLESLCSDIDDECSIYDFLFLDTETTGLSGGAGTVAFLVGAGFFEEDCFVLRQYFMRDYDEETGLLYELNKLFKTHSGLVSFNGRSYDWNIICDRYTFNRMKISLSEPIHIDLLHPSRRIWKLKLENCKLSTLEENILGEFRVDDIPGEQIPSVYFKYLEDRNACDLVRVIRHNEKDILSMVSLLVRIHNMLQRPEAETDGGAELLGIGGILEKAEREIQRQFVKNRQTNVYNNTPVRAASCYEACTRSSDYHISDMAARKLAEIYKRQKEYEKAAKLWMGMVERSNTLNTYAVIELAKYYEHRLKDHDKALSLVEEAYYECLKLGVTHSEFYKDLKTRRDRLIMKIHRPKAGNEK